MKYRAFNHNGTVLGEYATEQEAKSDVVEYSYQTGNFAYYELIKE